MKKKFFTIRKGKRVDEISHGFTIVKLFERKFLFFMGVIGFDREIGMYFLRSGHVCFVHNTDIQLFKCKFEKRTYSTT